MKRFLLVLALLLALSVTACGPAKHVTVQGVVTKIVTTEDTVGKTIDLTLSGANIVNNETCNGGISPVIAGQTDLANVPTDNTYKIGEHFTADCKCGSGLDDPICTLSP
jgi:hypothetical protein